MPTITASKWAKANGQMSSNFSTARTSNAGSVANQINSSNSRNIMYFRDTAKGTNFQFTRFFAAFNTGAYEGSNITSGSFYYRSTTSTSPSSFDIILCKSTAQVDSSGNFSNMATSEFYSSIAYTTPYSATSGISIPSANQWNSITLNSTALAAIANGSLGLVMLERIGDYGNNAGVADVDNFGFMNTSTSSSYTPYIDFTVGSSGYGLIVNGCEEFAGVNDIETGDITNVIGAE
jgi:hypothetical protein